VTRPARFRIADASQHEDRTVTPSTPPNTSPPSDDHDERNAGADGMAAWTDALRDMAPHLHLGWTLAAAAAGPPLLGFAVDWGLGTTPWGMLVGGGIGLAAAAVQLKRLQEEFGQ
jgi:hypothetical protein